MNRTGPRGPQIVGLSSGGRSTGPPFLAKVTAHADNLATVQRITGNLASSNETNGKNLTGVLLFGSTDLTGARVWVWRISDANYSYGALTAEADAAAQCAAIAEMVGSCSALQAALKSLFASWFCEAS